MKLIQIEAAAAHYEWLLAKIKHSVHLKLVEPDFCFLTEVRYELTSPQKIGLAKDRQVTVPEASGWQLGLVVHDKDVKAVASLFAEDLKPGAPKDVQILVMRPDVTVYDSAACNLSV